VIACVIGNGPSRLQFDLETIGRQMTTYGCNALYRDYITDYLISMDYNMVDEIIKNKVHYKTSLYTQHENRIDKLAEDGEPINFFWGFKETNDSGNSALRLALQHDNETIYIVGFDYNNGGGSLPNVYAGTNQYPRSHIFPAASMQTDKWRQRLNKILKEYPNKKIVRVNGNDKSFDMPYNNYSEITSEQFKEIYESRN
jgi:transposase-like protein